MSRFARRLQFAQSSAYDGGAQGPDTPSDITATPDDEKITLWWTAVSDATGYDVQYRISPSGMWQTWPRSGTVTHSIVTGLINGTAYDLRVRATNSSGESNWSSVILAVSPVATDTSNQGLPTELETMFVNSSSSSTVYAYVIGIDVATDRWTLVTPDGQGTYQPTTPGVDHTPLPQDCAILLNGIGQAGKSIKIPRLYSGRIFISYDEKMHFFMNRDGGFVMPSEKDPNDANIDIQWTFCEFTLNNVELYGNISFVDIVSIPIAFMLETSDGTGRQYVAGLPSGAMGRIASKLVAQKQIDGGDWDQCVYRNGSGDITRVLSPNTTSQIYPTAFLTYLDPYIDAVWAKYTSEDLVVNTNRVEWGNVTGRVTNNVLDFGGGMTFAKPSTQSIWSCSSAPWTTGNDEQGNITARITAAFNRTTLLLNTEQPNGENPETYYKNPLTNHYSRIVHEEVYGNLGYAFPYDDVHPENGISYEGRVQSSSPLKWTITVGEL